MTALKTGANREWRGEDGEKLYSSKANNTSQPPTAGKNVCTFVAKEWQKEGKNISFKLRLIIFIALLNVFFLPLD